MADTTIRPRPGDLERATHPHAFEPSGERAGRSQAEPCDLCGLVQRGTYLHPLPSDLTPQERADIDAADDDD